MIGQHGIQNCMPFQHVGMYGLRDFDKNIPQKGPLDKNIPHSLYIRQNQSDFWAVTWGKTSPWAKKGEGGMFLSRGPL